MTFITRAATAADVPAVLPMVAALCELHRAWDPAKYGYLPDIVDRYAAWLPRRATDPRSVFLVAAEGDRLVGFIVGTIEAEIPIYDVAEFGFVHDTWVEPAFRGRGVGRALALGAVERFRVLGVSQVRLDTAAANEPARRLFGACGFRAATVEMLIQLRERPG